MNEVSLCFTDRRLTYSLYDNYFIASFTPYLVEDAIRTFGDINYKSFGKVFSQHKELTKIKKDDGNIYLNYETSQVSCGGDRACANTVIENTGTIYFDGHASGKNAIIYIIGLCITIYHLFNYIG